MAINLDIWRTSSLIFTSVYSDIDFMTRSLMTCECNKISSLELQDICTKSQMALEHSLKRNLQLEDTRRLLALGRQILGIFTQQAQTEIRRTFESSNEPVVLRIRNDLVAIPWELLVFDDKRFLSEAFDVGRMVVASTRHDVDGKLSVGGTPLRMLILCDPLLKNAEKEGKSLEEKLNPFQEKLKVTLKIGIRKEELQEELPEVDILHFAGHADGDCREPDKIGWRLNMDERFDCETVARSGIARWPVLVFGNACHSQPAVRQVGESGLDGLAVEFLKRGVRHYVGTIARMPDTDEVVDFAVHVYKELLNKETVGASLRKARSKIAYFEDNVSKANHRGRLVAANYIHYGNPAGTLYGLPESFEPTQKPVLAEQISQQLDPLTDILKLYVQGHSDKALEILSQLSKNTSDEMVQQRLQSMRDTITQDRRQRADIRDKLKSSSGHVAMVRDQIGPFEIVKEIGHGSYRTIYKARCFDEQLGPEEVALAIPHNQHDDVIRRESQAFGKFYKEIQYPGLVQIHHIGIHDGLFCVAYELVKNAKSLKKRLDKTQQSWPLSDVTQLIIDVGESLGAAHSVGLCHGELTPQDILRCDNGQFKVLDVGRMEALYRAGASISLSESKARYRAPEQWTEFGSRYDPSVDVWSLAIIGQELLMGEHPFYKAVQEGDWAQAVRTRQPYPLSLVCPDIPQAVADVLNRGMARRREDRYSSANEMVEALQRALRDEARLGGFQPDLEAALESGATLLYVEADDEMTTLEQLQRIADRLNRRLFTWRLTSGLTEGIKLPAQHGHYWSDPFGVLDWLRNHDQSTILILTDYSPFYDESTVVANRDFTQGFGALSFNPPPDHNEDSWGFDDYLSSAIVPNELLDDTLPPQLVYPKHAVFRQLHEVSSILRRDGGPRRTAIVVASSAVIPQELSKEFQVFHREPVRGKEIREVLTKYGLELGIKLSDSLDSIVDEYAWNASGLGRGEIRKSLRLSVARHGGLISTCINDLKHDKEQVVRRQGLLELCHPRITLDDLVGLDNLKDWFGMLHLALEGPVADGFLPPPKGVLLGGMPGCGKSLCAHAVAGSWKLPLLRLDAGRIFGGVLGSSERNVREALATAENMSPCILWVDEIEKGFGHFQASGSNATSARVIQTFLSWLQDRSGCVFLMATANEGDHIPAELMRAGRFDAIFFLDLPNFKERRKLLQHELEKHGRRNDTHDFDDLSKLTDGFSSAEIAGRVVNALFLAAATGRADPTTQQLKDALTAPPPSLARSDLQQDRLTKMRTTWLSFALQASLE